MKNIICPTCETTKISKNGKTKNGQQRYLCQTLTCDTKSFKLSYDYKGWQADIEAKIFEGRLKNQSIREIANSLDVSKQKVQNALKTIEHPIPCLCRTCKN